MKRRNFLRAAVLGAGVTAFGNRLTPSALADPAQNGPSPYGPLGAANADGLELPTGFASRIIARSGQQVANTGYVWHNAPDGGAVFPDCGGWIYVSNSEITPGGGASAVRFDSRGAITGAHRILADTRQNCAGGATPWGTWLSCEEVELGLVYECRPEGPASAAVPRPAMGRFKHEAAAADPVRKVVYLTEDVPDGCLYRFVPKKWGRLADGTLQVLKAGPETSGSFTWVTVPDPDGSPIVTREQVPGAKRFAGGEGLHYANNKAWFTTKGDNRVWQLNLTTSTYELAYDDSLVSPGTAPLTGVDNVTSTASGDLYIAEDGGNMEICVITPDDVVAPFLRVTGHSASEICGPAFSPAGNRLYFSSQRGTTGSAANGVTFEVTGPFRR